MRTKTTDRTEVDQAEAYRIWGLMGQVDSGLYRTRDNEVRPMGISATQMGVLVLLRLTRMEKQGLVRLVRPSEGKRRVQVEATDKGKEVCRQDLQGTHAIQRILGSLSASERERLASILDKLRRRTYRELAEEPPYL
ncbi:MAG: hypothetical protein NTU41_07385 [Chloroflexi bacterium]|nr:hypothetical protein [Chloroflexota bacterium]